jgi:RNA polymerase sigma-70 factor (ECF subfamily)
MARINLRDYYPSLYNADFFTEAADEVVAELEKGKRENHNHAERVRYHKAYFSLDRGDGIENAAVKHSPSAEDVLMGGINREELYAALGSLPEHQRRRIEAHCIDGISKADIARAEGKDESSVRESIERGLLTLRKKLKNYF